MSSLSFSCLIKENSSKDHFSETYHSTLGDHLCWSQIRTIHSARVQSSTRSHICERSLCFVWCSQLKFIMLQKTAGSVEMLVCGAVVCFGFLRGDRSKAYVAPVFSMFSCNSVHYSPRPYQVQQKVESSLQYSAHQEDAGGKFGSCRKCLPLSESDWHPINPINFTAASCFSRP